MDKQLPIVGETGINPRYVAYAKAHDRTPGQMMEHDRAAWPGGCMCGFLLWISEQRRAFYRACPSAFIDWHMIADQAAWTEFLMAAERRPLGG